MNLKRVVVLIMAIKLTMLGAIFINSYEDNSRFFIGRQPEDDSRFFASDDEIIPVEAYDIFGSTRLMNAVSAPDLPEIVKLLKAGANVNAHSRDYEGGTPLIFAVQNGFMPGMFEAIALLVEYDADINAKDNVGMTVFHYLNSIPDPIMMENLLHLFVDRGGDINAINNNGDTMMHIFVYQYDPQFIWMIRQKYGSILDLTIKNNQGYTPAQLAQLLSPSLVEGDDSVYTALTKPLPLVGEDGNVNARDIYGRTGLMLAILRSDIPFIKEMIARKADVNARDNWYNTPLHLAAFSQNPLKIAQLLIEQGAQINVVNSEGKTPLRLAQSIPDGSHVLEYITYLKEQGAQLIAVDREGFDVEYWAEQKKKRDIKRFLDEYHSYLPETAGDKRFLIGFNSIQSEKLNGGQLKKRAKNSLMRKNGMFKVFTCVV
ncbi:MAG: ankyrin repeat domain-containing protein [Candidatus Dependentiae bacterium]